MSPNPFRFTAQQLTIDNNEFCDTGDINQDGVLDILAGEFWYEGPDFTPHPVRSIPPHAPDYLENNGEYLHDVDQDGWLDVITTGWGNSWLRWYRNPGAEGLANGDFWEVDTLANTQLTESEMGFLTDLDQDGEMEYLLNSWNDDNPLTIWPLIVDSLGQPAAFEHIIGEENSHGIGFGDVNGDEKTDVLTDDGWYEQPAVNPWSSPWAFHPDWELDDGSCPILLADINQDQQTDLIWGSGHDYGLFWLNQTSGGWQHHHIDLNWSQAHTLLWIDLDLDGQTELITGKRVRAHSGRDPGSTDPTIIYAYQWNADRQVIDRYVIAEEVGTGLTIQAADLNQDGMIDLVVAGKTGTYILWQGE
ncbi:MAG: VCBS repeat-containing protein [Bacteroidota bacterium]